ncbi:MAG: bifunctional alpha,alpha-trehalose-phosphate synthase (UDP-forming)/trehalose-phosphatase [Candidatus Freyarchaeota archaeon]|nr:bifunctional alpha,alpha-trehalose-phosphate synthase (UDP-forming)/trehalose-phosphatase [Candidatus Freyrarchaeum guaymaensis]
MGRLLLVSNRLPVTVVKRGGKVKFQASAGGLATGLSSFYRSHRGLWVGWPGITLKKLKREEREKVEEKLSSDGYHPVFLSQHEIENYYHGFCNKTIWPLFHYFTQYTVYDKAFWTAYKHINEVFCDKVLEVAREDDIIWVHDYHLMLLPMLLRKKMFNATIGFFLHIPFPSFEIFRLLPWHKEILEGLLGADLIGFHTYDYVRHFLDSISRLLGYEHTLGQITVDNRIVKTDVFPMGIDYNRFAEAGKNPEVRREIEKIRKKVGNYKVVLSIDRLDYTKGIPQRLEAFDLFLEENPEYREKVTLVLVAVPSRTGVEHYKELKRQVDELIGKINGKHGTIGWMPIWYLYRFLPFNTLVAMYNVADIALITPLRDGMNLIAKEFIATKTDGRGVLILSEMAGAAKELGEAIIVNPNDKEDVARALKDAITMPEEEQVERNRVMQRRLQRYDIMRWASDFIDRLSQVKKAQRELCARRLTSKDRKKLLHDYSRAGRRLILLDYDGTLVPFAEKPERAKPDEELIAILEELTQDVRNEVVIVSGRDRNMLGKWFDRFDVGLIAEHGVWVKEAGGSWETIEPLRNDWKDEVRPLLELYVDRTPGSFIEEKEFSLVWHYRRADPELGLMRARELKDDLLHLTANLNLGILEGNKVIEVKNAGINKGRAVLHWLSMEKWDFILAAGDDWTDEDVFSVLPESAYSIKVGLSPSQARFNVPSLADVRSLLRELAGQR